MENSSKMQVGEKYLDIKIIGHDFVRAFPNKNKTKDDQPDFKSDGIGVWVREIKEKKQQVQFKPANNYKPN